jgi:hypothetical protein
VGDDDEATPMYWLLARVEAGHAYAGDVLALATEVRRLRAAGSPAVPPAPDEPPTAQAAAVVSAALRWRQSRFDREGGTAGQYVVQCNALVEAIDAYLAAAVPPAPDEPPTRVTVDDDGAVMIDGHIAGTIWHASDLETVRAAMRGESR